MDSGNLLFIIMNRFYIMGEGLALAAYPGLAMALGLGEVVMYILVNNLLPATEQDC